ncbi:MAG: RIP metalloprotease RseP [Crocinitomicaceae bacterium]
MEFWIKAAQLILSLSILVILHEFGHYIPARWFKTRVEKFYLFFDPGFSLYKKKIGDTEWGIGWLPLGGYVKIAGMIDESMDTKQMEQEPQPWEFRSKPAWQRLIIMLGGVTVNLILGFLIYMAVLGAWGKDVNKIDQSVLGTSIAPVLQKYGLQDGDKIIRLDNEAINDYNTLNRAILLRGARKISVIHENGEKAIITLPADVEWTLFKSGDMMPFQPRFPAVVDTLISKRAIKSGLKKGDKITSINGKPIKYISDVTTYLYKKVNFPLQMTVDRNGEEQILNLQTDSLGKIGMGWQIGMKEYDKYSPITHENLGFTQAIAGGFSFGYWTLHDYVSQMKFIFSKKGASSLGGFGAIGNMFQSTWDWHSFWLNTALLSIILAFMNILPIPALDGGHVVFLLYEIITGREPNKKVLEYAQIVGIVLLFGLLLYANGNDLYKWLFK